MSTDMSAKSKEAKLVLGFTREIVAKQNNDTTCMQKLKDIPVDRPFSNGGQLMCHEVFIYVEDIIGSTWVSDTPASNFCKRDYRTPAWVNIVISLHGS
jgi:hypothetical protein